MVGQKRTINESGSETENMDPLLKNKKQRNALKLTEPCGEKKTDEKISKRDSQSHFKNR